MTPQEKAVELIFTLGRIKYAIEAVKLIENALEKYGELRIIRF